MSRVSQPPEMLTHADISWIKLCRHDMECVECGGRWNTGAKDYCDERKRLLKVHFDNAQAEKKRTA